MRASSAVPRLIIACCALAFGTRADAQDTREIRGRVIDGDGLAVAGVAIGTNWSFDPDGATPSWRSDTISTRGAALHSDPDGRFSGTLYFRGRPVALTVVDLEGDRGGTIIVTPENVTENLELTVGPLRGIRGRVEIETPILRDNTVRLYAFDPRAPIAMATVVLPGGGDYALALPAGPYKLSFVAGELKRVGAEIDLSVEGVDLGTTVMPPTDLARLYGKPAPEWTVTAARGADVPVRVSDFEGRWVLMEYWSFG